MIEQKFSPLCTPVPVNYFKSNENKKNSLITKNIISNIATETAEL